MSNKTTLLLAGALALAASASLAAGFLTNGLPPAGGTQYPTTIPLTGNETAPFDTNLPSGANPASESVSVNQLAATIGGGPSRGNALIGGDATTNLWQRGTAGTAATTTEAYNSADRWAIWSGTGTEMKLIRSSTAADLPTGYQYAFKFQRTASQTGVIQACMAQEVASVNSYQFAGATAELDFHAYTGANFSPAAPFNMTAYIIYGTSTDEGMQKLAFGLNGGGGGSTGWTGQTNATAAVIPLGGVSTAGRYAAIAAIPSTATEVGVALCYTPVGTAGTNDYIAFDGIQLIRNPANASYASATIGYSCANVPCSSFERRGAALEAYLQYTYYQQWADGAAATFVLPETCTETTSGTTATCLFNFPVTLRATPTVTVNTATSFGMTKVADGTAEACSTFAVVASTAGVNGFKATCAASETAAVGTMHIGLYAASGATNLLTVSAEL